MLVDFHAEATSEKLALGWYLDGRVSAVWGTHTHVPTADGKILPKGTGHVTDLGMTGPANSILGIRPEQSINYLSGRPAPALRGRAGKVQVGKRPLYDRYQYKTVHPHSAGGLAGVSI